MAREGTNLHDRTIRQENDKSLPCLGTGENRPGVLLQLFEVDRRHEEIVTDGRFEEIGIVARRCEVVVDREGYWRP